jgi:hypothetical protein
MKFVATQIVRVKAHLLCVNEQAGSPVPQRIFFHNMLRKMQKLAGRWSTKPPDFRLWTPFPNTELQFITGDNPVICFADSYPSIIKPFTSRSITNIDELLETPDSGFIVPLSPFVALTLHNGGEGNMIRKPQYAPPRVVTELNRCIYEQCVQFVAALDEKALGFHAKRITA